MSTGWKMLRINRVDQVREYSPWPGETATGGQGGGTEELIKGQEEEHQLERVREQDIDKVGGEGTYDVNEHCERDGFVETVSQRKQKDRALGLEGRQVKGGERMSTIKLLNSDRVSEKCVEGLSSMPDNNNSTTSADEEYCFGFDAKVDRDPMLLVADAYEDLIDKIEVEQANPTSSNLSTVFSGDYQTRIVECRHVDCFTSSLPATLGLLPLPGTGEEWLCQVHNLCMLCIEPTPVNITNSVMCTMCARRYHTTHIDMEMQDRSEMELYICKLCTDPELVFKHIMDTSVEVNNNSKEEIKHKKLFYKPDLNYPPEVFTKLKSKTGPYPGPSGTSKSITSKGKPLQHDDPSLPPGWSRQLGRDSVNRWRVVITGPGGKRFWSRSELKKAFQREGDERHSVGEL